MIVYRPTYFTLHELVDPVTYNILGENAWWVLDPRLLWTLDRIRERYSRAMTINTWKWQPTQPLTMRGFRPADSTTGAPHSQHRYGRAADFDVEGMPADEVRADILGHPDEEAFWYITCLETGISWVHLDIRNWDRKTLGMLLVTP